ncbi:MAG TPA: Gfo/Idh/MocA family oxidoreductase [Thermoguttaceae bacterium]|nr:Gfo/Idh/MocA family oxidoreductase [Thermoguttaceae bacterium]
MNKRIVGANDRVRLGFIGVANRGGQLMSAFLKHDDMEIVALCDVQRSTLDKANARLEGKADTYGDFRELIDRKDVDAVVVATPDHWHAIQTITACDAGKDVYVEKPLSITIHEGRRMVEAARRNKSVVTVGLHRRSSKLYGEAAGLIRSEGLGKVTVCRAYHRSNMVPAGIGHAEPSDPPADLDWDMWLGPRPARPFQATIAPYKFRWWHLYSSQTANNGVHFLDCMRWMTGDVAPTSICAMGGRYAVDDDRTIPDTLRVTFEFPTGRLFVFGMFETSGNRTLPREGYFEIRGTQGSLYCWDKQYEVVPERGGQFQDREPRMEPITVPRPEGDGDHTAQHARNFLDCIRSREKPACDVEEGHRSTVMALLAKISWLTRSRLEWDPEAERITNHEEANSMLHYEYREPWKLG